MFNRIGSAMRKILTASAGIILMAGLVICDNAMAQKEANVSGQAAGPAAENTEEAPPDDLLENEWPGEEGSPGQHEWYEPDWSTRDESVHR